MTQFLGNDIGDWEISGYLYPEISQFPSNNTHKWKISIYPYLEISQFPGIEFPEILLKNYFHEKPHDICAKFYKFLGFITRKFYNLRVGIYVGWKYLGIITLKFDKIQLTIFGSVTKSGYRYPEVEFRCKNKFFIYLNSYNTFKTYCIKKNFSWLVHALINEFKQKKLSYLRPILATSGYHEYIRKN